MTTTTDSKKEPARALLEVSAVLIERLLGLPRGTSIINACWGDLLNGGTIVFDIESDEIPDGAKWVDAIISGTFDRPRFERFEPRPEPHYWQTRLKSALDTIEE
jgi:hypothetical protein